MSHEHDEHCKCSSTVATQSLDEMEFERGIWSAALYNDLEKLKKCIAAGQANLIDSVGYSPLHYAARNGHLSACELLIKAGADVDACTRSGHVTPLIRASLMGHEDIVKLLLQNGADICRQDSDGNTAYHKAAQNAHQDIMSILLSASHEANRTSSDLASIQNKKGQIANDLLK